MFRISEKRDGNTKKLFLHTLEVIFDLYKNELMDQMWDRNIFAN